jgi:hypothetical protein
MRRTLGLIGTVVALVAALSAAWLPPSSASPTGRDAPCTAPPFPDVPASNPFCAEITWLAEHDIAGGFPDGSFQPAATVSRQSMAAFLYRLRGMPRGDDPTCATAPFPDVPTNHPFCGEITWLADAGIAGGFPDGTYRPTTTITRQFMAAFLYRMVDAPRGLNPACGAKPFTDVAVTNDFCGEIAWLKARGVVQGADDGLFRPRAAVTRQAMAGFLHELDDATGIEGGATPLDFDLDGDADLGFSDDQARWFRAGEAEPFWVPREVPDEQDVMVPGDYNGNGTTEPATILDDGTWHTGGLAGDIAFPPPVVSDSPNWWLGSHPVPGDYDGDGDTEPAWYDFLTGTWHIRGSDGPVAFGTGMDEADYPLYDTPAPGDYDGDGDTDIAVYSPVDATLSILGQAPLVDLPLGLPLAVDLDGEGIDELVLFDSGHGVWRFPDGAVLEPSQGVWEWRFPLSGDFDADGLMDLAFLDEESGAWFSAADDLLAQDDRAYQQPSAIGIEFRTLAEYIRFSDLIDNCDDYGLTCPPTP